MTQKKVLLVPFTPEGHMFGYNTHSSKTKPNFVFNDTLSIETIYTEGGCRLKSGRNGCTYYMFSSMLRAMILKTVINKGVVTGSFSFVKRGPRFSIYYVGDANEDAE